MTEITEPERHCLEMASKINSRCCQGVQKYLERGLKNRWHILEQTLHLPFQEKETVCKFQFSVTLCLQSILMHLPLKLGECLKMCILCNSSLFLR